MGGQSGPASRAPDAARKAPAPASRGSEHPVPAESGTARCSRSDAAGPCCVRKSQPIHSSRARHLRAEAENAASASHSPRRCATYHAVAPTFADAPQVVMRLHQRTEPGLILRPDNGDIHLGKFQRRNTAPLKADPQHNTANPIAPIHNRVSEGRPDPRSTHNAGLKNRSMDKFALLRLLVCRCRQCQTPSRASRRRTRHERIVFRGVLVSGMGHSRSPCRTSGGKRTQALTIALQDLEEIKEFLKKSSDCQEGSGCEKVMEWWKRSGLQNQSHSRQAAVDPPTFFNLGVMRTNGWVLDKDGKKGHDVVSGGRLSLGRPTLNLTSGCATLRAWTFQEIMLKQWDFSSRRQSKDLQMHSLISERTTLRAWVLLRITSKRQNCSRKPPRKGCPELNTISGSCTSRGGGVPRSRVHAYKMVQLGGSWR